MHSKIPHQFTRPGQVAPDRPAPDACMICGQPEAAHASPAAGPFETERQASASPQVCAVYEAFDRNPHVGGMAVDNHKMLCEALTAAGVELGAWDHRILLWLAGYEPSTCAVIAGLISRAHQAGGAS
jgi:hypothetical protein